MYQTQHLECKLTELKLAPVNPAAALGTRLMEFSGYGAVFDNLDACGDVIEPGAFSHYLSDVKNGAQNWPIMLLQHGGWGMSAEDMTPIGAWVDLAEDGAGLKVIGHLADTPRGREIYTLMKMQPRAAIDGLSIGYIAQDYELRSKPADPKRRLKRIDLVEISPVTFPANHKSRVSGIKAVDELSEREFEKILRDAGFSKKEAMALISRGFRSLKNTWDAENDRLKEEIATIEKCLEAIITCQKTYHRKP